MSDYPLNFELQNDASTKYLNVVVEFEGTDTKFSLLPTYKRVRWGDPDIYWGQPGLVWGGLLYMQDVNPIISPNTQLVIGQTLEPEQGRASASTMQLEFVDVGGFMSNFVAPGKYVDEVLGGKLVKVLVGYQNTGFPEDYFVFYRGYVSMIQTAATKVILQLTDANLKRRQQIFSMGKTQLRQINYNFPASSVNFLTDRITVTGHKFKDGNRVQLFTDGSLPGPLVAGTDYYILNPTTNDFQLSLAPGGSPIDLTSTGSGNDSVYLYGIGPLATEIPVIAATDFVQPILGPNGAYDTSLLTYIKINDEIMQYNPSGLGTDTITVVRARRNTLSADHSVTDKTAVDNLIELEGNIVDLSLKLMLSGWAGVWTSGLPILKFVQTGDPSLGDISTALMLPTSNDAVEKYGLAPGDFIYITGAANPLNNGQRVVTGFLDRAGITNNIILCDVGFVAEAIPSPAVFSTRSQYDTLPDTCGSRLRPIDVDVATWQEVKTQALSGSTNVFRNVITGPQSGKDFIESQYLLPAGAYSVARFGRLSVSITRPPLASDNLVVLNKDSVIEPQNITVSRGLNNRRFFNEVQYYFDYDDQGNSANKVVRYDVDSLSTIQTSSVLPIKAEGLRTENGALTFINKRLDFILKRYKDAATQITLKTNWKTASLVEVSNVVALYDNGGLQITNLQTGQRDMGNQLFEVIQRQIDIKTGVATLTLLGQTGYQVTDRFGGIAPSSLIGLGSSTMEVILTDSFGKAFPFNEKKKWEPIIGDRVCIHSPDYSFSESRVLVGFQPGSSYRMLLDAPLSISPPAGYVVDCDPYPDTADQNEQAKSKLLFSFLTPTLTVVSGISTTQFTVSPADANNIFPGLPVSLHNANYSQDSSEATVDSVVGVTITLKTAVEFIPSAGMKIELVGYRDLNGPYRIY